MHTDVPYFPEKLMLDQFGYYVQNPPVASVLNRFIPPGINHPTMPFRNVDVQPSRACPRNFIIFDQTNVKSQIMFNPEISSKFCYPGFNGDPSVFQDKVIPNDEDKIGSSFEEDYDDIDALLSSEYEEEPEDDTVSTARTSAIYDYSSPDSCSNYEPVLKKRRTLFKKPSENRGNKKKNRKKVTKMVKMLRGIVPGANQLSSVAVLDEAVRYLKSLKVDIEKLGIKNF